MGMKEEELKILEHKVLKEDSTEHHKTQDSGQRSGGTLNKLLSAFAGVWPTSKAASEVPAKRKKVTSEGRDGLWWHDLVPCQAGDVSVSVVQANHLLEDQCCIESASPLGTVIGVFDGHRGPDAAWFARDHLLPNLQEALSGPHGVTTDAIRKAFMAMEEGFSALVSSLWETKPSLATIGTSCLVGVVRQGTLFVANLGDSRAVLGKVGHNGRIIAEQLSTDHNVCYEEVRKEVMAQHPDDPQIVVLMHGVWRVKRMIQVSRSIGDAYLKHQQFNREPLPARFRLPEPFSRPLLSASPSITPRSLQPSDRFIIFASDGLWEHLSNEEAAEMVHKHERTGIARRLVEAAMREAARKREMRYTDLKRIEKGLRVHFHDDITVIVLFIDHKDHAQGHRAVSIRST
ncbi:probable protein phosphatase 2C 36 [Triticum dicoccoides]|uniref:probable protein phosphatase 2C 36 n=1 Tax=Triticum dicoccoides TaxID=85692 RepID=UPI00188F0EB9|nr:probable protein phosphatase 2C 36 [Triticum dicoccoides]